MMRSTFAAIVIVASYLSVSACMQPIEKKIKLKFDSPAEMWEETLPLGNGRLGAMPDGGKWEESIVLNEETMWSGTRQDTENPDAAKWLDPIRSALLEGRNNEAEKMMFEHFTCKGNGSASPQYGCYQTLGKLIVSYEKPSDKRSSSENVIHDSYTRGLSLNDALAVTDFSEGGIQWHREYFVSIPDDVIAIKLESTEKRNLQIRLSRDENAEVIAEGNYISMRGTLPSGIEKPGVSYICKAFIKSDGNEETGNESIEISNASQIIVLVSAATSYNHSNPEFSVDSTLKTASRYSYKSLKNRAQKAFKEKFDRVKIELPDSSASRYAQFGRYLLIGSTARATLPPNLQGIWADQCSTPWNGDYHLNVNVEMNHWPAQVGNLSEADLPMTDFVMSLAESGKKTASCFYGTGGWVAHVLSNVWGFSAPSENPSWGATFTGGAWAALQLWEHYLFTLDKKYLEHVYPVLKESAEFLYENLFIDPSSGKMVTGPSSSPENAFILNGEQCHVCLAPAMDIQIIRELFNSVCQASSILELEDADKFSSILTSLPQDKISRDGRVQEWQEDYFEAEPQHRHVSHLFGLYPGHSITSDELKEAARKTLNVRGDEGTGWSRAWKICFWARLGDGNRANKLLQSLMSPVQSFRLENGSVGYTGAGTFPNLFCSHPPFQIDGNFGGSAGIMEMLIQSHETTTQGKRIINILPAIPNEWNHGKFNGLKARGNITVDCEWSEEGTSIRLVSPVAQTIILRLKGREDLSIDLRKDKETTVKYR